MHPVAAIEIQQSSQPVEAAGWTSDRQDPRNTEEDRHLSHNQPRLSRQTVAEITEAMSAYMASVGVKLQFHIDESTDRIQVEVRDPQTDKLIRKIPPDDILRLAAAIEETVGVLMDREL